MKRTINITIACLLLCFSSKAQETVYGPAYQTMLMSNPALSGAEGKGTLRMSYLNFLPGNGYNLHSFYISYDSYFSFLQGGVGLWITNDKLGGIISDFRGGVSYSYALRAGENLYINAGLSAGLFHRGLDFSSAVLPDMIDQTGNISFPTGEPLEEANRTVFDPGAGFLFLYKNTIAGLAVNHLSQPVLYSGQFSDRLKRKVLLHAATNINLSERSDMTIMPALYIELQGDQVRGGLGSAFGINHFSVNAMILSDSGNNLNLQTGFSINAGTLSIFYNYRLNIISGDILMPFSLMHQTGLAFSLNDVEKRNVLRTISFPKM